VDNIFDYLNRYWITSHSQGGEVPIEGVHVSVRAMGVAMWREHVQIPEVSERILDDIWNMSMKVREGGTMDYILASRIVSIYADLGSRPKSGRVYDTDFADAYVNQTLRLYMLEAQQLVAEQDCSAFVIRAHWRITSELASAAHFLQHQTLPLLRKACEHAFISEQRDWLQTWFDRLLQEEVADAREQLWRIYTLLRRVEGGLDLARERFSGMVAREGTVALSSVSVEHVSIAHALGLLDDTGGGGGVASASTDGIAVGVGRGGTRGVSCAKAGLVALSFLESVFERCVYFHTVVHECFENDAGFVQAADKGLVLVINSVKNSAELLAIFAHSVLEKGGAAARALGGPGRGVEDALQQMLLCLKYLLNRETFQDHYVRLLAHRLISDSSLSLDAEEYVAEELRKVASVDFSARLQRMLTDRIRSLEQESQFVKDTDGVVGGLHVLLLTAGTWPLPQPEIFRVPEALRCQIDAFSRYYEHKFKRRKLTWLLNLSRADVRASFLDKRYEMTMSLKQLSVLLVYEDRLTQDASASSARGIRQDAGEGGSGEGGGARSDRSGGAQRMALRVSSLAEATGLPLSQVIRSSSSPLNENGEG
jgi:hypothetical protein